MSPARGGPAIDLLDELFRFLQAHTSHRSIFFDGVDLLTALERLDNSRWNLGIGIELDALMLQQHVQLPLQPGQIARRAAAHAHDIYDGDENAEDQPDEDRLN